MKIADVLRNADAVQHSRAFKIAASVLLILLAVGAFSAYAIGVSTGRIDRADAVIETLGPDMTQEQRVELFRNVLAGGSDVTAVAIASAASLIVALVVVWLGLGLTYLLLGLVTAVAVFFLWPFEATNVAARLLIGIVALSASFTALIQGLRVLFSPHTPTLAVARNVLAEAVRMKISLVFIVLLLIGLAALPALLDPEQPLRYRVQSFLQWSTGGAFWVLAILTLFFGVATVTFEQREKVIWQTMTKPVAVWQYLLGKWLGVAGLNAVLLAVCASGIFLFTEYLRSQPALGEREAYVASDGAVSEDRLKLETEILQAREQLYIEYPQEFSLDSDVFQRNLDQRIENEQLTDPNFASTPGTRLKLAETLIEEAKEGYRAIAPGDERVFRFTGLSDARERAAPIIFRYKVDAEGNRPDIFFSMSFVLPDGQTVIRETGLGFYHNIQLSPEYISPDGELFIRVLNGKIVNTPRGPMIEPNSSTARFPADGLIASYVVGSYQANYLRVVFILWVKLAFLAMLAVTTGTFLSFSVASLVSFGVFLLAELSRFIGDAADYYGTKDIEGNVRIYRIVGTYAGEAVGWMFNTYAQLRPTNNIVEGIFLPWSAAFKGIAVLGGFTVAFYLLGIAIMKRRELAVYSGQ